MKKSRLGIILMLVSVFPLQAETLGRQIPPEITDGVQIQTRSTLYNQAYLEMSDMLDGKIPLSIKRAVFLAEWAYLDGRLSYDAYCHGIDSTAVFLWKFILANGLGEYKTGKNMALMEYFFRPYSGNNYLPFTYNFEDTAGKEDFTNQFVSKVMRTHKGQCRSLPWYYKVLAEAIGAEAYLSYAPSHVFIRYRDEDNLYPEDWVNLELTSQQIQPEFGIKEHFDINETTIAHKVYLHPLSDRETVAAQLADLAFGYWRKYEVYDDLTWLCAIKSLEYYPQNPKALLIKANSLEVVLAKYMSSNGYQMDEYASFLVERINEISDLLASLGWEPVTDELYDKLEEGNAQGKLMQEIIEK
ncbi:MAG: hypothetical protein LUG18_01320 [Candidatus Azobacteroides sp.]|nr:hypothetical protein [Candidatus Azobacteroides sp.]